MKQAKPRVLLVSWSFPPLKSIACVRLAAMAVELQRRGWQVSVLTPHAQLWSRVETDGSLEARVRQAGVRMISTGHDLRFLNPIWLHCKYRPSKWTFQGMSRGIARRMHLDTTIGWSVWLLRHANMFHSGDYDLVLASGPPFSAFRAAIRIARHVGCPYVLDYRDPWTLGYPHGPSSYPSWERRAEYHIAAKAAAALFVSENQRLQAISGFPHYDGKAHVVPNGFDPEDREVPPLISAQRALVYAGSFYPPNISAEPIMRALRLIHSENILPRNAWKFHYYGANGDHVREEAMRHDVAHLVVGHGEVPRVEVLSALRGAHVAIVITNNAQRCDAAGRGIITGKVFEAIGLGTPVALIAPEDSDARDLILKYNLGESFTGVEHVLLATYLARMLSGPRRPHNGAPDFEWPAIGDRVDAICRNALHTL